MREMAIKVKDYQSRTSMFAGVERSKVSWVVARRLQERDTIIMIEDCHSLADMISISSKCLLHT